MADTEYMLSCTKEELDVLAAALRMSKFLDDEYARNAGRQDRLLRSLWNERQRGHNRNLTERIDALVKSGV